MIIELVGGPADGLPVEVEPEDTVYEYLFLGPFKEALEGKPTEPSFEIIDYCIEGKRGVLAKRTGRTL